MFLMLLWDKSLQGQAKGLTVKLYYNLGLWLVGNELGKYIERTPPTVVCQLTTTTSLLRCWFARFLVFS